MSEIGSEFITDSFLYGHNDYLDLLDYPKRYVLSGRTGLNLVAQELKMQGILSVSLPSYCCSSMVVPFVEAQVEVEFYENDCVPKTDAILIMDYFGFIQKSTLDFAINCKNRGLKIIVDATQTAFSKSTLYTLSDYLVVSYRKWFDCLCAAVYSREGFKSEEFTKINDIYINTWRRAADLKKLYLNFGIGGKRDFLNLFKEASVILASNYINCATSINEIKKLENIDSTCLRNFRRNNARVLLDGLIGKVELMFTDMSNEDCPLHVPIILNPVIRDKLRKHLVQKSIYCPCHWPLDTNYQYKKTKFHDYELSLICDQRYSQLEMSKQLNEIIIFFKK